MLIVDDDPDMAETLSDILNDMGYDVAIAENGYRAIEMTRQNKYDVALMDIMMPGINGVETFKEVKQISPQTRVIMMTAYSVEDLLREALKEGACGIIYKPIDIDKLIASLQKFKNIAAREQQA